MKKYVKKPVVIEAIYWDGSSEQAKNLAQWGLAIFDGHTDALQIFTLEGMMTAQIGDWVIKGIKGEFYPCKPDIFEMTYEEIKNAE